MQLIGLYNSSNNIMQPIGLYDYSNNIGSAYQQSIVRLDMQLIVAIQLLEHHRNNVSTTDCLIRYATIIRLYNDLNNIGSAYQQPIVRSNMHLQSGCKITRTTSDRCISSRSFDRICNYNQPIQLLEQPRIGDLAADCSIESATIIGLYNQLEQHRIGDL
jgi:hypothetical protein